MLNGIIEAAKKNNPEKEGDYRVDDLLYCGKCHTKKERWIESDYIPKRKVPCLCACATAARDAVDRARKEEQEKINKMRLRSAGFPDRAMMEWTFDNDDGANPEFTEICKRYVEHFNEFYRDGKGLLFYGTVGTGKTFMASCIANALIEKGKLCLVTNFARITNEMQADFNHRQEYLDKLNQNALLIIDDLAAERDTEYMNEIIMNVIDARYRVKKPLIVTTNLTAEELGTPSDIKRSRVFSRLFEMCLPYEVKGNDRRRKSLASDMEKYSWLFGKEN